MFDGKRLTERLTDRIRLQQEDPPHDALRPHLRRRVRAPSLPSLKQGTNSSSGSPTLYQHESASKSSPGRSRSVSRLPTARPALRPSRRWVRIFTLGRGIQGVSLISYDLNGKAFHPLRLTVPLDYGMGRGMHFKKHCDMLLRNGQRYQGTRAVGMQ
jgi:hypothetical protein